LVCSIYKIGHSILSQIKALQEYFNDKWNAGGHGTRWAGRRVRDKYAERYPKGTKVQIHYNPSDPANSLLLTSLDTLIFLVVLVLGFSFLFMNFLVFHFLLI